MANTIQEKNDTYKVVVYKKMTIFAELMTT